MNPAGASRESLTSSPRVREHPRLQADIQSPEIEVRFTPSNRHSLAGTPCLLEITWLWEVVYYHGGVGRLAHTMVKESQNAAGVVVV